MEVILDDEIIPEPPPPPPAKDCQSIYSLTSLNNDIPFPFDIFIDSRKAKPIRASFYKRLKELRDTDRVFVKPVSQPLIQYIDLACQFEVLNKDGKPIFFALDTTDAWASTVFEGTKPFNVMILNYDYAEVLKIIGPGLSRLHGSAFVNHSGKPIGRVIQEDHLCSFTPSYSLEGVSGITGLKVRGPDNSLATGLPPNPVFDILLIDEVSLMGRITKQWVLFGNPTEESTPEETYVLNFHPDMELRTKALLLAIVFMIDYQFYHKTVKGGVSRKCWFWFSILFFSLVIFILVAVDLIKDAQILSTGLEFENITSTSTMSSFLEDVS